MIARPSGPRAPSAKRENNSSRPGAASSSSRPSATATPNTVGLDAASGTPMPHKMAAASAHPFLFATDNGPAPP